MRILTRKKKTPSIYLWIRFQKRFASLMNSRSYVNELRLCSINKINKMICFSSIHVEHETNCFSLHLIHAGTIYGSGIHCNFSIFYSNEEATLLPSVIDGELSLLIETKPFEIITQHWTLLAQSLQTLHQCIVPPHSDMESISCVFAKIVRRHAN